MYKARACPNTTSYNSIITTCEKGHCANVALQALEQCEAWATPDAISYCAAVSACGKAGDWQHAVSLSLSMWTMKIVPDVACYNAVSNACEKVGRWHDTLVILKVMCSARVLSDATSFNIAISSSGKGQCWRLALQVLETCKA
eukprot:gnl/MRDRNA2_/MRDRNA2_51587_c0_seq1.p1 gnl/MRDRNA2_/MRDRNA2_51587_c0~~gnl/MRDRNA2_/MRDRNA2_51587_c0_seq1.p1  ORF type:complete len:143 (+),score=10.83 gnl/MRDRNA2_/MRDRNA2_51587_c0_seq1:58-486(+)